VITPPRSASAPRPTANGQGLPLVQLSDAGATALAEKINKGEAQTSPDGARWTASIPVSREDERSLNASPQNTRALNRMVLHKLQQQVPGQALAGVFLADWSGDNRIVDGQLKFTAFERPAGGPLSSSSYED